jgi:excisionase family DNA binding protein
VATLEHSSGVDAEGGPVDVDQAPARDTQAAQPAQGADRAAEANEKIAALVRLLARQAAHEHLHRLAHPETSPMKNERQPTLSKLLLIDQVAEGLGLSTRTVRRLIARGELVACRFGRSVRVHPDDLARYIDRHRGL